MTFHAIIEVPTEEEKQEEREESGWKLVHADVFRPPANMPLLFCVFVGTGLQLFWMTLITICFAAIGFLSPANRGSLMIAMLLLYVVMGAFAGYQSANLSRLSREGSGNAAHCLRRFCTQACAL